MMMMMMTLNFKIKNKQTNLFWDLAVYLYVCDTFYVECDWQSVVILLVSDWRHLFCFLISKFTRFAPDVTPGSSGSAQESWASSRSSQCEVSYTAHSYSMWHMICSTVSSVPLYNIRFRIYCITTTEVTELLIACVQCTCTCTSVTLGRF